MPKLIIQIPAYNEEETLAETLSLLPRDVPGFDSVEWLIIDDGSKDGTVEVAKSAGADHIVKHTANLGLAKAFTTGLDACLRLGADVIVNTDADNQYPADAIPALTEKILSGEADMVIGDRGTSDLSHFSWTKRRLQFFGSWVVRKASGTHIKDAPSGFRAISRRAALDLNIVSGYSYTLETIIQAGHKGLVVSQVPVSTRKTLRKSRLFSSIWGYVGRSAATIIRIYAMYQPMKVFLVVGGILWMAGFLIGIRFLYYYFTGSGAGLIQSLLLAVLLMLIGFQVGVTGVLADLIRHNRKLIEESLYRIRKIEIESSSQLPEGIIHHINNPINNSKDRIITYKQKGPEKTDDSPVSD